MSNIAKVTGELRAIPRNRWRYKLARFVVAAQTSRISTLEQLRRDDNRRWCRIEEALKLPPWHSCPTERPQP